MKKILICIIILFGCTNKDDKYFIITDNARGLKKSSKVYCKGIEIGTISNISLYRDSVLIEMEMEENFKISRSASIFLSNVNVFERVIEIGHMTNNFKDIYYPGDTISLILDYPVIVIDSVPD